MRNGVLYRRLESDAGNEVTWKLVVPKNLRSEILGQLHNSTAIGHLGIKRPTESEPVITGPDVQEVLSDGTRHVIIVRPGRNQTRPQEP